MNNARKILLVDDDAVTHFIIKRMADHAKLNWEIKAFLHPADALWALNDERWQPQLAIIDHHLPEINGVSFVELLRQQGHNFPWIWISSALEKPFISALYAPEACFTKPLLPDAIQMCDTLASLSDIKGEAR